MLQQAVAAKLRDFLVCAGEEGRAISSAQSRKIHAAVKAQPEEKFFLQRAFDRNSAARGNAGSVASAQEGLESVAHTKTNGVDPGSGRLGARGKHRMRVNAEAEVRLARPVLQVVPRFVAAAREV